ncbi:MAG: tetratricopeptide repeat protein, partial [candidate division Zixibacteria bacterium]|nr:tetratricopeptide repeat protein [candidate division Zixibacteria bacterium]
ADLYAYNGKIDQAIDSYKKALAIKPDFYWSLSKLGHMYLFKRKYTKAESCYQELSSSSEKDTRSDGRTCLALIPLYQGKLEEALEVVDDGIAADRMEQAEGWQNANKHWVKTYIYEEKKNLNLALKEFERFMEIWHRAFPNDIVYCRDSYVQLLAENNDFKKAEKVAKALKKDIAEKDQTLMDRYWYAIGCIEFSKGNLEASLTNFEKSAKDVPHFWVHYMLAKTYLESGRLGEAVAELEKVLSRYDDFRAYVPIWAVKAHYLLGIAYEKSGWNKKAIEKYEEFLEIWKDADPGIPEVEDAKERVKKLTVGS